MLIIILTAIIVLISITWTVSLPLIILKGAPFVTSHPQAVQTILELADIKPGEKAIDIGSGDGRIVTALAHAGAQAYGYEIHPFLALWSRMKIRKAGLADKARIFCRDFWKADLSEYDIICIFGIPHIMAKLQQKILEQAKPAARVLTNCFEFKDWTSTVQKNSISLYHVDAQIKKPPAKSRRSEPKK